MTTNQRYAGYNRRFDKRARLLRRFGFVYAAHENVAYFTRNRWHKPESIAAAFLSFADNAAWFDKLRQVLRG